jgi:hypothetical protein
MDEEILEDDRDEGDSVLFCDICGSEIDFDELLDRFVCTNPECPNC